jgi:hypothetical protein
MSTSRPRPRPDGLGGPSTARVASRRGLQAAPGPFATDAASLVPRDGMALGPPYIMQATVGSWRKRSMEALMNQLVRLAVAAFLTFAATQAEARPDTRAMTCDQVVSLIERDGAVVLTTGQLTYDRFVAGPGACSVGEAIRAVTVPTRDGPCRVLRCAQVDVFQWGE